MKPVALALSAVALVALAACAGKTISSNIEDGSFGNATMNTMLVQSGQIDATRALGERFAGEIQTTVTFPFNSAQLTPEAQATLNRQADWIRQFPEVRFRVYGHTDLVGSDAFNKRLGQRRAEAVVAYFASRGISRSRLEALVSFGETRPVIATQAPEEQNRRTVTEVSGFVENHPSVLDGNYAAVIYRESIISAKPAATVLVGSAPEGGAAPPAAPAPAP